MFDDTSDTPARLDNFGMVDARVMRDPSLPFPVKAVYALLATYAARDRTAFPSKARIARELGMSVRTVDRAIRAAVAAGLMSVDRRVRGPRDNDTNLYRLHDFSEYRPPVTDAGGVPQEMRESPVRDAGKHNHLTEPVDQTITSSDTSAVTGHGLRPRRREKITLYRTERLLDERRIDDGEFCRQLVKDSIGALRAAGLEPEPNTPDRLGRSLSGALEHYHRAEVVELLEAGLRLAGTDDPLWGSIAYPSAA